MPLRVNRSPRSIFDLAGIIEYFLDLDAIGAGERFSAAYDETLDFIRQFPDLGEERPELRTRSGVVRVIPIRGFPNYLVYFRRDEDRVTIVRILHGSRQIDPDVFPELPT